MRARRVASALVPILLLLPPAAAEAQFFGPLEGLFNRVDAFTVFATAGGLTSSEHLGTDDLLGLSALRGMGVEILIDLTPAPPPAAVPEEGGANGRAEGAEEGDRAARERRSWGLELGLGADYLTGFVARDPSLDLRGSMRGLPNLSAYVAPPVDWGPFQPYLGLGVGFAQLWNVQGYDPAGRQYDLSGDTFQLGTSAGLYHGSGFFLETSYRNRNFRSVRWELPSGVDAVPAGWPRSLDLSALLVSVGYQFGRLEP